MITCQKSTEQKLTEKIARMCWLTCLRWAHMSVVALLPMESNSYKQKYVVVLVVLRVCCSSILTKNRLLVVRQTTAGGCFSFQL